MNQYLSRGIGTVGVLLFFTNLWLAWLETSLFNRFPLEASWRLIWLPSLPWLLLWLLTILAGYLWHRVLFFLVFLSPVLIVQGVRGMLSGGDQIGGIFVLLARVVGGLQVLLASMMLLEIGLWLWKTRWHSQ